MIKVLYILFILPTVFSCPNEKSLNNYFLLLNGFQFNNKIECKDYKNFDSKNNFQSESPAICLKSKADNKALENFEKQSKVYDFAENIYFRSKVSKIRNKDDLDLKSLALKSYDEGKTMKDAYTHHFNKVYRVQITEL